MKNKKIRAIKLKINSKEIFPKNYCLNSMSKSNLSTSNFSSINPEKNFVSMELDINKNKNKASFIYKRKKGQNMNINNNYKKFITYKNSILLDEYRKRIMKLFLSNFKQYYLFFLRKYFYSFIRNITFFIMDKELFNAKNINSINILNRTNLLNKSSNNFQILNQNDLINEEIINSKNSNNYILMTPMYNYKKTFTNFRFKNMKLDYEEDNLDNYARYNQYSCKLTNTINTEKKFYDFKNVFISFSSKKNKIKNRIFTSEKKNIINCFSKKIKDIITKDNRIYIRINYIFLIPKKQKRIRNISEHHIQKINESLDITQIYSFEYINNKEKNFLNKKEELEEKIKNFDKIISKVFILKFKRLLLYKLKAVIFIKYIERIMKKIFFNKLGSIKKEKSYSSDIFFLDDKLNINIDNFQKLDEHI